MKRLLFICIVYILVGCKSIVDVESNILLSEIVDKQNYEVPLIIENDMDYSVSINGRDVNFRKGIYSITDAGYYEMISELSDTIRFVLMDIERGDAEWGLKKWFPKPIELSESYHGNLLTIYPRYTCEEIAVPIAIQVDNRGVYTKTNLKLEIEDSTYYLKRGLGIYNDLPSDYPISIEISGAEKSVDIEMFKDDAIEITADIETPFVFSSNKLYHIKNDITVSGTGGVTINEGCVIIVDEGVNINVDSPFRILGGKDNPVLITSSNHKIFWGGFIISNKCKHFEASNCFFTKFGYHYSSDYMYGHARHQALIKSDQTNLNFKNCYFVDSPGQVFYPIKCNLTLENCAVMRVKTAGQINSSVLNVDNCYFSDFPNDDDEFQDEDNDVIYISMSDAFMRNSVFMYAKDDGVDTGGSEGGTIRIESCRFEAIFHEGIAMSSAGTSVKKHNISNSLFLNCQQGLELGYSSPNHEAVVTNCTFKDNYIGARYGDNYTALVEGRLEVRSSLFVGNDKHTWNMLRADWLPRKDRFIIDETNVFE